MGVLVPFENAADCEFDAIWHAGCVIGVDEEGEGDDEVEAE